MPCWRIHWNKPLKPDSYKPYPRHPAIPAPIPAVEILIASRTIIDQPRASVVDIRIVGETVLPEKTR